MNLLALVYSVLKCTLNIFPQILPIFLVKVRHIWKSKSMLCYNWWYPKVLEIPNKNHNSQQHGDLYHICPFTNKSCQCNTAQKNHAIFFMRFYDLVFNSNLIKTQKKDSQLVVIIIWVRMNIWPRIFLLLKGYTVTA